MAGGISRKPMVGIVLLFAVLLLITYVLYKPAKIYQTHRDKGPDSVTVQDVMNGKVHVGDYVTVQGALWTEHKYRYWETRKSKSGSSLGTQTWEYDLLVAPEDPALKEWHKVEAFGKEILALKFEQLEAMSAEKRAVLSKKAAEVEKVGKAFKPAAYISVSQDLGSTGGDIPITVDMPRLNTLSPPGSAAANFNNAQNQIREGLQAVTPGTTITGMVRDLPNKVKEEGYGAVSELPYKPTVHIASGDTPQASSVVGFLLATGALLLDAVVGVALMLRRTTV